MRIAAVALNEVREAPRRRAIVPIRYGTEFA